MNLSIFPTKHYENENAFSLRKNKANQSQFQRPKNAAAFDDEKAPPNKTRQSRLKRGSQEAYLDMQFLGRIMAFFPYSGRKEAV